MGKDKSREYYKIDYWEREALYRIISQAVCAPIEGIPYCKARGNAVTWEATARFGDTYTQFEGRTPLKLIKEKAAFLAGVLL